MTKGNNMHDLFMLNNCRSKRISSYDVTGGNQDSIDIHSGETVEIASIKGSGIIRHIWMTQWTGDEDMHEEPFALRGLILRMYWDGEEFPSVEAPLGDFFGIGFGLRKNYSSMALAMCPENGKGMSCFFPMPFLSGARVTVENTCVGDSSLYYYIDYEAYENPNWDESFGYFHAQFRRERDTAGWAPKIAHQVEKDLANMPGLPKWLPKAWLEPNTTGDDNYVLLEATGRGKYVGCNLNIDALAPQYNDWYGEGDDMIFIDGEPWPPSLHGTGTEDYIGAAFCPTQEFHTPWQGITVYNGDKDHKGYCFAGKQSMYRLHIHDPIYFEKSIRVTIEHGHANKLSNDYSSTAYWYQVEPHQPFAPMPSGEDLMPRPDWTPENIPTAPQDAAKREPSEKASSNAT